MSDSRPRLFSQSLLERMASGPNEVLLETPDRSVTVEEFARGAASFAVHLCRDEASTPVIVLVDRSIESAMGLYGVQWSGRCVVPISVDEPKSRLIAALSRLGPCAVVDATGDGPSDLDGQLVERLTSIPDGWIDPVAVPLTNPSTIIFTSGSTGRPKGIIRLGWQSDAGWAILSRDGGKSAIFGPLHWLGGMGALNRAVVAGSACLIETRNRSPQGVLQELADHEVTRLSVTPSLMSLLSQSHTDNIRVPSLGEVVLNGESATWETVASVRRIGDCSVTVRANYGASESIRGIMRRIVPPSEEIRRGPLDLGDIIGDHVHLATRGEFEDGYREVVIRRWVAAGYVDDEALKHSRFGTDVNGDPEWRSGDVVRVDSNGCLWHTGRSDDLVKIGGKLVSPSEAASVLSKIDGVRRAVVLTKALDSRRIQLIGHVEASEDVDPAGVRRKLADELPAHLIPAVLVRHDRLPLANGGKVDRQRLLGEPLVQWRTSPRVDPRNDLERFVLIEVTRMLGLPDLGVDDDLWTFGLDSLGAIELSETLSRALSSDLTVNDFIGASTVSAIAQWIAESRPSKPSNVVTLVESESEPSVFIMTGAGSPALRYRELAHGVARNAGVVGFEQWGLLQRTRPDRSIVAAAKRNVRHIVDAACDGQLVLIGHPWGGHVAHEMALQLTEIGREVLLVMLDSGRSQRGAWSLNLPAALQAMDSNWLQRHRTIARWRLYWMLRPRLSWLMRDDRFQRFFWRGIRTARRHRAGEFHGPMLVMRAETSTVGELWLDQPGVRIATTTGDHLSMCHAPHVHGLADIVNAFIISCLADGSVAPS